MVQLPVISVEVSAVVSGSGVATVLQKGTFMGTLAPIWSSMAGPERKGSWGYAAKNGVSFWSRRTAFLMARALSLEHLGHLTRISQTVEGLEQHG